MNEQDTIRDQVRRGYAQIASSGSFQSEKGLDGRGESCSGGGCCGGVSADVEQFVKSIGYSDSDLLSVPESANMALSCGNPTAIASLDEGETVLDLGSGGGFDVFVAGPKVGASGRVIGVDMTPEMIAKARRDTAIYSKHSGLQNVEFRLGEIENLPVADSSIDVVISNCVLNLSPNKPRVWEEIYRVLRSGGRVAISDLALLKPLPESVLKSVEALIGCVAGATLLSEIEQISVRTGFREVRLVPKAGYVDTMASWQDPLYVQIQESLPAHSKLGDYIVSVDISAVKP